MKKLIVAIDGPAGSGKSTVTHLLSRRLGYIHIDTGALYRAIAYNALENRIDLADAESLGKLTESCELEFKGKENGEIHCNGKNLSKLIRTPEVSMAASTISAHPEVRNALLGLQRKMGEKGGVVLEGRDIGTVVFPHAEVKFFLTASVEMRARRRMVELEEKGTYLEFEEVKNQVMARDKQDTERKTAPLQIAADAIEIDTSNMTIDEVVAQLTKTVKEYEKNV